MDISYAESLTLIQSRIQVLPKMQTIATEPGFTDTLKDILRALVLDESLLEVVVFETKVILALYSPLSTLPTHLTESTGISSEKAAQLAAMIETLLLEPVYDELLAYETYWMQEIEETTAPIDTTLEHRERLELKPEAQRVSALGNGAQPLTREELMSALGKRTMAGDIEAARARQGADPTPKPTTGYGVMPREQ